MEPSGSDSDGKVGNVSEHVSFCPVPLEFLVPFFGNSKEELGHDYRLPQDLVISWVLSGRTEYAGQKSNFQEDPVIKKESDLCHVRDWRPTGSALNLVRDSILHFFVMFLYWAWNFQRPLRMLHAFFRKSALGVHVRVNSAGRVKHGAGYTSIPLGPVQGYSTDSGLFIVIIPGLRCGCGYGVVQSNM